MIAEDLHEPFRVAVHKRLGRHYPETRVTGIHFSFDELDAGPRLIVEWVWDEGCVDVIRDHADDFFENMRRITDGPNAAARVVVRELIEERQEFEAKGGFG